MLYFYTVLTIIILLTCYVDYSNKKVNYQDAKKLNTQFNDWIRNKDGVPRPNNALFVKLYTDIYGDKELNKTVPEAITFGKVKLANIDILRSFPSKENMIIPEQLAILDNLEDYYTLEFQRAHSMHYFIKFIFNLPLKLLQYVGINTDKAISKIFQILWWIISLFLPDLKKLVINFIMSHLK